jgi:hypothetical protein
MSESGRGAANQASTLLPVEKIKCEVKKELYRTLIIKIEAENVLLF